MKKWQTWKKCWRKLANKMLTKVLVFSDNWSAYFTDQEFRVRNSGTFGIRTIDLWLRWFKPFHDLQLMFEIDNDDENTVTLFFSLPWLVRGGIALDMRRWQWTERFVGQDGSRSWGFRMGRRDFTFNWGLQQGAVWGDLPRGYTRTMTWERLLNGKATSTTSCQPTQIHDYVQIGTHGYGSSSHEIRLLFMTTTTKWSRWWKPNQVVSGCEIKLDEPPACGPKLSDRIYSAFVTDVSTVGEAVDRYRAMVFTAREREAELRRTTPPQDLGMVSQPA